MVNDARPFLLSNPRLMIYPGLAIGLAVVGFNLLGDGLRDRLDPRTDSASRPDSRAGAKDVMAGWIVDESLQKA